MVFLRQLPYLSWCGRSLLPYHEKMQAVALARATAIKRETGTTGQERCTVGQRQNEALRNCLHGGARGSTGGTLPLRGCPASWSPFYPFAFFPLVTLGFLYFTSLILLKSREKLGCGSSPLLQKPTSGVTCLRRSLFIFISLRGRRAGHTTSTHQHPPTGGGGRFHHRC